MVLETIEQDNYNRKYGDKKPNKKKHRKLPSDSSSSGEQVAYTHPARKRKKTENHLTTRFGLLFYNDKIIIPENMRTTVIAMLHQGHPSATKMDKLAAAFWWPGIYPEIREKAENCPSCRASGKNLITQLPYTEKKTN